MKFDDTKIEKFKFRQQKSPILINNIDINKIVLPTEVPFSKQNFIYFIGYKDAKKIRP